jgi:DmsE family decaheme c-type cytochrome
VSRLPILVLALGVFALGPAALERGPSAEDTEELLSRQTNVCLDCHEGYDEGLAASPHRVATEIPEGTEARVACTDCHVGDSRHYEEDPEEFPMARPDTEGAPGEARICSTCHQNSHQQNMRERNVHFENDVACSGCHRIHGSTEQGLLQSAEVDLCLSCHAGVEGQFAQPFRHPVNDGIMKCSECHLSLDRTARELSLNGTNSACVRCHGEFEGPFPFEHQAALDYSTEEGGCLNCHAAHGSAQPRMLRQPYEPPHFQICTQCHSVPPLHNQNSFHGSMWAGIACNECHTDIHGSYTNRSFLSQSLEGQGCLKAGCHQ